MTHSYNMIYFCYCILLAADDTQSIIKVCLSMENSESRGGTFTLHFKTLSYLYNSESVSVVFSWLFKWLWCSQTADSPLQEE